MVKKIAPIIAICCFGLSSLLFYRARTDPISSALRAYRHREWETCIQQLARAHLTPDRQCLFEGYLSRGQGNFAQSDQVLSQGLQICRARSATGQSRALEGEFCLNILLNQYRQGRGTELSAQLALAKQRGFSGKFYDVFGAICAEEQGQNKRALELLQGAQPLVFETNWLSTDLQMAFAPTWQALFRARNSLALGKSVQSRQILDTVDEQNADPDQLKERALLTAQSYLLEAPEDSEQVASAYYRLASSYLNQKSAGEFDSPPRILYEVCLRSFAQGHIESCSALIERLQQWGSGDDLTQLAAQLADRWLDLASAPSASMRAALAKLPPDFRDRLDGQLRVKLREFLAKSSGDLTTGYQNALLSVFDSPRFQTWLAGDLAFIVMQKLQLPAGASPDWSQVEGALQLFKSAISGPSDTSAALSELTLRICELIGERADADARRERALSTLLDLPGDKSATLRAVVASEVKRQFDAAWTARDFDRMSRLCDLSTALQLRAIPPFTASQVSDVLGDAEYCMLAKQTARAISQLRWILKVLPEHREATAQLVKALCEQNQCAEALHLIDGARRSDLADSQIFCQIQLGQIDQALIASQKARHLSDTTLENLGGAACRAGAVARGAQCLARIAKPSQEVWSALASAYFADGQFQGCWDAYQHLNAHHARKIQLQTRALISLIELRLDQPASLLAKALFAARQSTPPASDAHNPEPLLAELEPIAALARYYRERLQDYNLAELCLALAKSPNLQTRLERARLLLETERAPLALATLQETLPLATGVERALYQGVHCRALIECGHYSLALQSARQLAALNHLPSAAVADCTLALEQLECWEEALELMNKFQGDGGWPSPPLLHRLKCLGELGRHREGAELIRAAQNAKHPTWTPFEHYQLAACGLKSLIGCAKSPLQPAAVKARTLTTRRRAQIAQYYLDIGDLEGAKSAQKGDQSLALTPAGRLALAGIGARGDDWADKQLEDVALEPTVPYDLLTRALESLAHLQKIERLRQIAGALSQRRADHPCEGTLFRLAEATLAWSDALLQLREPDVEQRAQVQFSLRELEQPLVSSALQTPQLVRGQILLARLLTAIDRIDEAQAIFQTALALNEWNGPANFGRAQNTQLSPNARLTCLQRSCYARPERPDYWLALGDFTRGEYQTTRDKSLAEAAKSAYLRANLLDPRSAQVYFAMAQLLTLEGELPSAAKLVRAGIERTPDDQRCQVALDLPSNLRALTNSQLPEKR